jgi:hypothetical protein
MDPATISLIVSLASTILDLLFGERLKIDPKVLTDK